MTDTAQDILDRRARAFALLTEQGLELCTDLKDAAIRTDDLHAKAELALAHQRVGRSLRQTLALEARLLREEQQIERERKSAIVTARKSRVRAAVERLVWTEAEREEVDPDDEEVHERLTRLDTLIDFEAEGPDFLDEPLEAVITRLAREIGVTFALDATRPAAEPAPDGDYWSSG